MGLSSKFNGNTPIRSSGTNGGSGVPLPRSPSYLLPFVCALAFLSLTAVFMFKVDDFAYQTKTVAGHNLEPTPWHIFEPKVFDEPSRYARASKILQCQYFSCRSSSIPDIPELDVSKSAQCPEFFRWIHHDLEPWSKSRISMSHLMEAKDYAAFRVIIVGSKLYVDIYYACVQSRMMFTIWGLLQLLKRYPGFVPDVDMIFDCMDRPTINRTEHSARPLPLFRYCTTSEHFDIPFPDWSFWGWPEVNLGSWDEEFRDIKRGSQSKSWIKKWPYAYWKGNPDVAAPLRAELLQCNDTNVWRAQILRQDWGEEARTGYTQSKLSSQCNHRYKIYAEGFAWSVSLKYILSCDSLALLISPQYEDFFTRGLLPKKNYWPVSRDNLCPSIKYAVDWGNAHPNEASAIGKAGQDYMDNLNMARVYDYMFHLLSEYSKLLDFQPVPPASAQEVCMDSVLCFADPKQKRFFEQSTTALSPSSPCTLPVNDGMILKRWMKLKDNVLMNISRSAMAKP